MKAANHACSVFLRAIILRMKQLGLNHTSLAAHACLELVAAKAQTCCGQS